MSFPIPVFPLTGNIWTQPATPSGGAATITNVQFQLYVSPHMNSFDVPFPAFPHPWNPSILIKTPEGGVYVYNRYDIIMPDNTVADYYLVLWREHYYKGFPQAFLGLLVCQCQANGSFPRNY